MLTRITALLIGMLLVLLSPTGLPLASAAPHLQQTEPASLKPLNVQFQRIEDSVVLVDADGTTTRQVDGFSPIQATLVPSACTVPAPSLISPVGGAQVNTLMPYFQWSRTGNPVSGFNYYRVQISTLSNFSTLIYVSNWGIGGTSDPRVTMNFNLLPSTTYYWRVANRCEGGQYSAFSSAASFRTSNVTGPFPAPPSLIAPADGAIQASMKVDFSWGDASGATAHQIRIYDSLAKAQNDDQWHAMTGWGGWNSGAWQNNTSWTAQSAGTYYWRVGAGIVAGWGALSPVRSFTVGVPTYAVTGFVRDSTGGGIQGVTISTGGRSAVTDASGSYTLDGLPVGSYTLTPSKEGYTFCPNNRRVDVSANASGQDFTGFGANVTLGFCPNSNGYRFSNSDSAWGSFPLTAHDYSYVELVRMFGQDSVCWMTGSICWVKPQADLWHVQANLSMNGGHCDGMASTSLRFFKGFDQPSTFSSGATTAHDLQFSDARRHIAYYFVEQLTDPVGFYKEQIRQTPPSAILAQLRAAMQDGAPDPATLFVRKSGEGGHAITPYAIEDRGAGVSWVRVYDNNYPDDFSRYVVIDTVSQTWSYDLGGTTWTGDASTKSLGIVPISKYAEQPVCPWCGGSLQMAAPDNPPMQEVWLNGTGHLLITDALGRRLGYSGAQFLSEIPQAYGSFADAGRGVEQEPIYRLPVSAGYTILLDGQTVTQPQEVTVSQFGPGYAAQIDNIQLGPLAQDRFTIAADGSQIAYQPSSNRRPTLSLALDDGSASYELEVVSAEIDAGQRVTVAQQDMTGRLVYSNAQASGGEYGLSVRRVSSIGTEWFAHNDLTIAAGDTQYAAYRSWDGQGVMTLEVDHGSDGTIDETVSLENQIRRVYLPVIFGK